jgi:protein phosphatase
MLLLCSDGLYGVVPDEAIAAILRNSDPLPRKVTSLKEAARAAGAPDNISCILLRETADPTGPAR